jgi:hypothetical protein
MSSAPPNNVKATGGVPENTDSNSDVFGGHPVTWILLPICCLAFAAICIGIFRYRKRKRSRLLDMLNTTPSQRDVEAGRRNGPRRTANPRWQWAGTDGAPSGRRRAGVGVGSREEGLNELGEAPPAYTASKRSEDDVELGDLSASPTGRTTSVGTSEPRHVVGGDGASPPEYGEPAHSSDPATRTRVVPEPTGPATPAAAVLPSR